MKITITIPDNCVKEVEAYCRKHLHMSFQARIQQAADKIASNILALIKMCKKWEAK